MAFRLKLDEPVGKGFKRVGVEQISRAERELRGAASAPATAIHETRKCLKRMRALLRLFRSGLGDDCYRKENARYREIGVILAPARDNHVLIQTTLSLETLPNQVTNTGIAALRKLLQEQETARPPTPENYIDKALEKLAEAAKQFRRLKSGGWDFDVVEKGLERAYRRSHQTFEAAFAAPSDEALHEWRKTVQQHWRHMQLLSRAWPEYFGARINAAKSLSQILGDDHDLAILRAYVAALPAGCLSAMHVREIERLAVLRQETLRREAAPRGRLLLAEGAKGMSRRVAVMWRAAQNLSVAEGEEDAPLDIRNQKPNAAVAP